MTDREKTLIKELNIKNLDKINKKAKEIKKDRKKFESIKLCILGEPKQTQRPRTTKFGKFYVPNAAKNKKAIRKQIKEQFDYESFDIIDGEIHIITKFYVGIPKGFSNTDKVLAERKLIKPTVTPDVDNFLKTYMDALTGIIWLDDGQVTKSYSYKYYSIEPRVEIEIRYSRNIHCSILKQYAKNKKQTYELLK